MAGGRNAANGFLAVDGALAWLRWVFARAPVALLRCLLGACRLLADGAWRDAWLLPPLLTDCRAFGDGARALGALLRCLFAACRAFVGDGRAAGRAARWGARCGVTMKRGP